MHRVLSNLREFEIFNSGMQNRFNESGESYRISAGSDVIKQLIQVLVDCIQRDMYFVRRPQKNNKSQLVIVAVQKSGAVLRQSKGFYIWCDLNGTRFLIPKCS